MFWEYHRFGGRLETRGRADSLACETPRGGRSQVHDPRRYLNSRFKTITSIRYHQPPLIATLDRETPRTSHGAGPFWRQGGLAPGASEWRQSAVTGHFAGARRNHEVRPSRGNSWPRLADDRIRPGSGH